MWLSMSRPHFSKRTKTIWINSNYFSSKLIPIWTIWWRKCGLETKCLLHKNNQPQLNEFNSHIYAFLQISILFLYQSIYVTTLASINTGVQSSIITFRIFSPLSRMCLFSPLFTPTVLLTSTWIFFQILISSLAKRLN